MKTKCGQKFKRFGVAFSGDAVRLITISKSGRYGDVISEAKRGFEGNIPDAIGCLENGNTNEAIRIFQNRA